MGESTGRIRGREELVGVVEEGCGLDQPAVDRACPRRPRSSKREPGSDLGDGARVPQKPGRWIEGQQQLGGLDPPGNGHPLDGTAQLKAGTATRWVMEAARRGPAADAREPVGRTVIPPLAKVASTDPSVSVRKTAAPAAAR